MDAHRQASQRMPRIDRRAGVPRVILFGASTGGLSSLTTVLAEARHALSAVPVFVAIHMPDDFIPLVASHIERLCKIGVRIVAEHTIVEPGFVFLAPGNGNLAIKRMPQVALVAQAGSARFCEVSVDKMFTAAAPIYGAGTLAIVLSGMGKDGVAGSRAVLAAGGSIIVQDKATCAVWGMPAAVLNAGLTAMALPPRAIARELVLRLHRSSEAAG